VRARTATAMEVWYYWATQPHTRAGGLVDRALFYAVVGGGIYALATLVLLDNEPIAVAAGVVVGALALARGAVIWG